MRNMSFSLTTKQFIDGSKTVTRRLGWKFLKAGDRVMAVEKGMGLKKGEKVKRLGAFEVQGVRREPLHLIPPEEVSKEGFLDMTTAGFIKFFCDANSCYHDAVVTVIKFKKI